MNYGNVLFHGKHIEELNFTELQSFIAQFSQFLSEADAKAISQNAVGVVIEGKSNEEVAKLLIDYVDANKVDSNSVWKLRKQVDGLHTELYETDQSVAGLTQDIDGHERWLYALTVAWCVLFALLFFHFWAG